MKNHPLVTLAILCAMALHVRAWEVLLLTTRLPKQE